MSAVDTFSESFKSGLVMILPLLISIIIVKFLAGYVFMFINPIVRGTNLVQYTGSVFIAAQALAILVVIIFITGLGYISNYKASERLSRKIENIIRQIPLFGSIYATVDQVSESFSGESDKFKDVVLVQFPDEGLNSLGLVTADAPEEVREKEEDTKAVYIPLSPNPTMGHLVMVPEDEYTEVDMPVQKAMKTLLTTGIASERKQEEIINNLPEELEKFQDRFKDT